MTENVAEVFNVEFLYALDKIGAPEGPWTDPLIGWQRRKRHRSQAMRLAGVKTRQRVGDAAWNAYRNAQSANQRAFGVQRARWHKRPPDEELRVCVQIDADGRWRAWPPDWSIMLHRHATVAQAVEALLRTVERWMGVEIDRYAVRVDFTE